MTKKNNISKMGIKLVCDKCFPSSDYIITEEDNNQLSITIDEIGNIYDGIFYVHPMCNELDLYMIHGIEALMRITGDYE